VIFPVGDTPGASRYARSTVSVVTPWIARYTSGLSSCRISESRKIGRPPHAPSRIRLAEATLSDEESLGNTRSATSSDRSLRGGGIADDPPGTRLVQHAHSTGNVNEPVGWIPSSLTTRGSWLDPVRSLINKAKGVPRPTVRWRTAWARTGPKSAWRSAVDRERSAGTKHQHVRSDSVDADSDKADAGSSRRAAEYHVRPFRWCPTERTSPTANSSTDLGNSGTTDRDDSVDPNAIRPPATHQ
jgi:hypothetical protein